MAEIDYGNSQNYRQYPSTLNQPTQSRWLTHKSAQETVLGKSSAVRHSHLRNSAFTFDHSISIGFISGLYGGRYRSSMPAAWSVSATSLTWCDRILSMTTMSPLCKVGMRISFRYSKKRCPVVPPVYVVCIVWPFRHTEPRTVCARGVLNGAWPQTRVLPMARP